MALGAQKKRVVTCIFVGRIQLGGLFEELLALLDDGAKGIGIAEDHVVFVRTSAQDLGDEGVAERQDRVGGQVVRPLAVVRPAEVFNNVKLNYNLNYKLNYNLN